MFLRNSGIGTTARSIRLCVPSTPFREMNRKTGPKVGTSLAGFRHPICDNRNAHKDECWIARSQHSSEHETSRAERFSGGCTKRALRLPRIVVCGHARTAPERSRSVWPSETASRALEIWNGVWQLESRGVRAERREWFVPGQKHRAGWKDRNRAHKATIWDENCTLLRLLRKQIVESRQTVVTC